MVEDPARAKLSKRERAMVEYALKLIVVPPQVRKADIGKLRQAGWKDSEIFEIAASTTWWNLKTKLPRALGYEPDATHQFTPEPE